MHKRFMNFVNAKLFVVQINQLEILPSTFSVKLLVGK